MLQLVNQPGARNLDLSLQVGDSLPVQLPDLKVIAGVRSPSFMYTLRWKRTTGGTALLGRPEDLVPER
jgi:hypothetical protein